MKYFVRLKTMQPYAHPLGLSRSTVCEATPEFALAVYRSGHDKGMENIVVQPLFKKGHNQYGKYFIVWGENISNRELFRRRLSGEIAKEVMGK